MGNESDATLHLDPMDLDEIPEVEHKVSAPPPLPPSVPSPGGADNDVDVVDEASLGDEALVRWLEGALSASEDPVRSAGFHFELGVLRERAGEQDRACEHYQQGHALAPEHVACLRSARRLLCVLGKYEDALPLYEAEVPLAGTPEHRALLQYQRGRVLEVHLARLDEALESYRQGLELQPRDLDLLRATARLERTQRRWAELDRTLETLTSVLEGDPVYRAQVLAERARLADLHGGDPERSQQLYLEARGLDADVFGATEALKRLSHEQGQWRRTLDALKVEATRSGDPEARASAQARVGELCVHPLGDLEQAAAALEAAATELPTDAEWLRRLADVYERAGRDVDHARVLDALRKQARSPAERADLAYRIGMLWETRLQDASKAESFYRAALEGDPEHEPAQRALAHVYEATGNDGALLGLVRQWTESERHGTRRGALHVRAGELVERMGGDAEQAVHHYRLALSLDVTQLTALRALDRLLPQLGRFAELAEVYEGMVDHAADDAQALLYLFRIGALQEDRLGDLAAATHAYERILRRSPGHGGALHALQRVAMASEDYGLLVQSLEQEQALLEPSARWALLGYRIAEVCVEVLDDPARALVQLRAILEHDGAHVQARELMARVYRREKRWDDLVQMRSEELAQMADGERRTALAYELGLLCERELGQVEAAVAHYASTLEAAPLHRPAFDALTRLLEREQRWEALVKVVAARAESEDDARERAHLAVRRGQLLEGPLGDVDAALQAYADALAELPGFPSALDARARLLSRQGRHADLAQALAEEADASADPRRACEARLRLACLQAELLDDPRAAEETLLGILEKDPTHLPALRDLEALYARDADRSSLARVYGAEVATVHDDGLRAAALRDLAHAHWVEPTPSAEAEAALTRVLELKPSDAEALGALADAAQSRRDAPHLIELLSALAGVEQDRGSMAARRLALAQLLEARAPQQALEAYRAALSAVPDSLVAARGLARTALAQKSPEALREAAESDARITGAEELAVKLLIAAAGVRRAQGDLEGAARDAESALERAPDEPRAAAALASALEPRGERARLADALVRAAERASRPERSAELFLRAAVLRAPVDVHAAIAACERALAAQPESERALSELAGYLERAGEWVRAADTLERLAEVTGDAGRRCDARLSLAEIAMERLKDRDRAIPSLRKVLEERPADRRALGLQGQIYAQLGQLEQACEVAERLVAATEGPAERAAALVHAARVMAQCARHEDAEKALLEAMALQGHDGAAARDYRARLRDGKGSWEAYVQALTRFLRDAPAGSRDGAATVRVIADVQVRQLGSPELALKSLMAGIGRWPDDPGLHADQAQVLQAMGEHDQALKVYREQLERHPDSPALWQGLSAAHRACGREEEALSSAVPLLLFEGAAGEDVVALKVRQPRPAAAQPGSFDDAMLRLLDRDRALAHPAVDLVRELAATLAKAQPADLSQYGLSRRDRIERGSESALWEVVDGVATLLGLSTETFELYAHDLPEAHVSVALTEPPALLVPRSVVAQPPATLVFALGGPLFLLSQGLAPVAALEPATLLPLLIGAVRRQREAFGSGLCDEAVLDEATRVVAKAVPWLSRKKVDEAVARFGETSAAELQDFMAGAQRCAARVALLLSDDPVGSLSARAAAHQRGLFEDAHCRELLSFWASEAACRYRSRR